MSLVLLLLLLLLLLLVGKYDFANFNLHVVGQQMALQVCVKLFFLVRDRKSFFFQPVFNESFQFPFTPAPLPYPSDI